MRLCVPDISQSIVPSGLICKAPAIGESGVGDKCPEIMLTCGAVCGSRMMYEFSRDR